MLLNEQITEDMKNAMRAKNGAVLSTLRLLRSALKNKQIDLMRELSETEVQDVIKYQVKQLRDAIISFEQGGREDMATSNKAELALLLDYLPKELSDEELEKIVTETVAMSGATSKADMGKVMGLAVKAVAGRADGMRVKSYVEKLLGVFIFVVLFASASMPAHASIGIETVNDWAISPSWVELFLKMLRIFFLWFGIFFINQILHGGFQYTVGGTRDDEHHHAMAKMTSGIFGTMTMVGLFSLATVAIQKIS